MMMIMRRLKMSRKRRRKSRMKEKVQET